MEPEVTVPSAGVGAVAALAFVDSLQHGAVDAEVVVAGDLAATFHQT
jgi:hypothetical protein